MNTRIQNCLKFIGLFVAVWTMLAITGSANAGQTSGKITVKTSKDQFQLTLSATPYSTNPESAFVRNHCEPAKKKPAS